MLITGQRLKGSRGEKAWVAKPPIPGDWRVLDLADCCAVVAKLTAHEAEQDLTPLTATVGNFQRGRVLPLISRPGWLLIELCAQLGSGEHGLVALFLGPGGKLIPINWTRDPLAAAYQGVEYSRLDDSQICEYIYLYCNLLSSEGRRFRIASSVGDLDIPRRPAEKKLNEFESLLMPMRVTQKGIERHTTATMIYDGKLFRSTLRFLPTGMIAMEGDEPLGPAYVRPEYIRKVFRTVLEH